MFVQSENLLILITLVLGILEARGFILVSGKKGSMVHYATYLLLAIKIDRIIGMLAAEAHNPAVCEAYRFAAIAGLRFVFGLFVVRAGALASAFAALAIYMLRGGMDALYAFSLYMSVMSVYDATGSPLSLSPLNGILVFLYIVLYAGMLRLVFKHWWPRKQPGEAEKYLTSLAILFPVFFMFRVYLQPVADAVASWFAGGAAVPADTVSPDRLAVLALPLVTFLFLYRFAKRRMKRTLRKERERDEAARASVEEERNTARAGIESRRTLGAETDGRLRAAAALFREGDETGAAAYMRAVADSWRNVKDAPETGCLAVDMLLHEKLALAESRGAAVACECSAADWRGFDRVDLIVVLSNLLDRALAAICESGAGESFVDVRIEDSGEQLRIEILNRYKGYGDVEENDGLDVVRSVVQKHNGFLGISGDKKNKTMCAIATLSPSPKRADCASDEPAAAR